MRVMTLTSKYIILFCYMRFGLRLAVIISISNQEDMTQTIEIILEGNLAVNKFLMYKYLYCSIHN